MGNLKRFLAMTLTMLMVVGCFAASGSLAAFDDVVDYQQQINLMSVLKIIEGYSEDEFGPDNDVERWHMALWIAKIMTGKVEDAYVNWYSTQNNTAFADLEVDHFFGSVSYCNENGVVIGTSATTFEPAAGIMIQDVFTMVVRMLGYGSASMDSNYPWSYVDKAIQLGLDKDLAADYNNEDVATREQAAVILYNALFAKKADGTTYAASKFNLTMDTIVLTGTSKANMFSAGDVEAKKLAGENYVAFNQLNADGTLGSETFYLLKSWFGFDDDNDENLYFGQSYKVITKDNYTTLVYCEAIEGYWVDQTDFDGIKDGSDKFVIEGKTYKAVKSYTKLNYEQGRKADDDLEVIAYEVNSKATINKATSYVMDANRNILDKASKIVFYYMPAGTATGAAGVASESSWKDAYKKLITIDSKDVYVTPSQADWDNVYTHPTQTADGAMSKLGSDVSSHKVYSELNAYSDTVLYDDNADGIYDRAMYTYYKFGFISYNDDKHLTIDNTKIFGDTKYDDAGITYITADGEKLAAADVIKALDSSLSKGNYVLYSYNKWTKYVTIKEFFTPNQGLVTSLDKPNSTITFDQVYYNISAGNVAGTKFTVGNAKLPGATKNEVIAKIPNGSLDELHGRNVHYIEKDGNVLAIYEAYNNSGKYLVFDDVVGINSTGYVNALVYNNSNVRSVVTIASIDGGWYGSAGYAYASNAEALSNRKAFGELFSYTTDALGNYHITWIDHDSYTYYYSAKTGGFFRNVSMKFINGISIPVINNAEVDGIAEYKFFEDANGVAKAFTQFNTNNDTVIVIMNKAGTTLSAFKGVPANNAIIDIYRESDTGSARIFVDQTNEKDKASIAKFVYINAAYFEKFIMGQAWNYLSNDTVIFIDDTAAATEIITNQTSSGYGVTLGTVYSYNKAIDFVNGGVKNDILVYNNRLTKGNFYAVKDGYVDHLVKTSDPEIGTAYLQYIDTYEAVWLIDGFQLADRTNYRTNYLYQLKGTDIVDVSADDSNPKNMIWTEKANINTEGAFAPAYYYAGNVESASNVFIYETITKGAIARDKHVRYDWIATEDIITSRWTRPFENPVILQNYAFTAPTTALSSYNWYEITQAEYESLSKIGFIDNDAFNRVLNIFSIGVSMEMLDSKGALVPGFNSKNVLAFTEIAYTNGGGVKYFLVLTSNPSWYNTSVGGSIDGKFTLRWADGITTNKMELTGFGIAKANYAYLFDNLASTYADGKVPAKDIDVELTTNFFDETKFENLYYNYAAVLDIVDRFHIVENTHSITQFKSKEVLLTWAGKDLYVRVPVRAGYTVKVEYLNLFNLITDGTNRNLPNNFWMQHWDIDTKWTELTATTTSLHPTQYTVYTMVNADDVAFRVVYTKIKAPDSIILDDVVKPVGSDLEYNVTNTPDVLKGQSFEIGKAYSIIYTETGNKYDSLKATVSYYTTSATDSVAKIPVVVNLTLTKTVQGKWVTSFTLPANTVLDNALQNFVIKFEEIVNPVVVPDTIKIDEVNLPIYVVDDENSAGNGKVYGTTSLVYNNKPADAVEPGDELETLVKYEFLYTTTNTAADLVVKGTASYYTATNGVAKLVAGVDLKATKTVGNDPAKQNYLMTLTLPANVVLDNTLQELIINVTETPAIAVPARVPFPYANGLGITMWYGNTQLTATNTPNNFIKVENITDNNTVIDENSANGTQDSIILDTAALRNLGINTGDQIKITYWYDSDQYKVKDVTVSITDNYGVTATPVVYLPSSSAISLPSAIVANVGGINYKAGTFTYTMSDLDVAIRVNLYAPVYPTALEIVMNDVTIPATPVLLDDNAAPWNFIGYEHGGQLADSYSFSSTEIKDKDMEVGYVFHFKFQVDSLDYNFKNITIGTTVVPDDAIEFIQRIGTVDSYSVLVPLVAGNNKISVNVVEPNYITSLYMGAYDKSRVQIGDGFQPGIFMKVEGVGDSNALYNGGDWDWYDFDAALAETSRFELGDTLKVYFQLDDGDCPGGMPSKPTQVRIYSGTTMANGVLVATIPASEIFQGSQEVSGAPHTYFTFEFDLVAEDMFVEVFTDNIYGD